MKRCLGGALLLMLAGCGGGDRDLPARYRTLSVPASRLESADAWQRGAKLFAANCAICHGGRGDGRGLRRTGLERPPRDFTDLAWQQATSPRRLFVAIREGLPRTSMPAWRSLSDDETWDLVAYILSVARE